MKTAEEILNKEWDNYKLNGKSFKDIALDAMKEYAIEVAKKALKDASDEASTEYCSCYEPRYDCDGRCRIIDKESILTVEIKPL